MSFSPAHSGFPGNYALVSMVQHVGGTHGTGHYRAFALSDNHPWTMSDDELVKVVDEGDVLSRNAYMLFYERQTFA